jgi:antitoxin (DNA-binding transcriptional repressor) of toxin-antitoxin stability system
MKTLNVHEAKTNLSTVLARIELTGESFLICRKGKPIADLVPHRRVDRLKTDSFLSRIKVKTDPTKPVSEGEWEKV